MSWYQWERNKSFCCSQPLLEATAKNNCPLQSKDKYQCKICHFTTASCFIYLKHTTTLCVRTSHRNHSETKNCNWLQCAHCDYKSRTRWGLKAHFLQTHELGEAIKWFYCAQCDFKTKCKVFIKRHVKRTHPAIQWFKCDHCDYVTTVKISLIKHVLRQYTPDEDIDWWKCKFCVFRCQFKEGLKKHFLQKHVIGDSENNNHKHAICDS